MREVDMDDPAVPAVEKAALAVLRVVDQLMREDELAGGNAADPAHGGDGQHRARANRFQSPDIGAVVHPVGRNGVAMTMAGQEHRVATGNLAEVVGPDFLADDEDTRRQFYSEEERQYLFSTLSCDLQRGQPGEATAAYDREHETCLKTGFIGGESGFGVVLPFAQAGQGRAANSAAGMELPANS